MSRERLEERARDLARTAFAEGVLAAIRVIEKNQPLGPCGIHESPPLTKDHLATLRKLRKMRHRKNDIGKQFEPSNA